MTNKFVSLSVWIKIVYPSLILLKKIARHCKVLKREEQHIACKGKMNKVAQTLYHMAALTRFQALFFHFNI